MKVVKRFQLVLDQQAPVPLGDQIDVVFENATKVGVRIGDAELVRWPTLE